MRKLLALLIVGTSVAVVEGAAFAGEPGKDSADHQKFPEAAVIRASTTDTGTIAGPRTPPSVWNELRYDNREH